MPYLLSDTKWLRFRGSVVTYLGDDYFLFPTGEVRKMIFELVVNHMQAL